MMTRIYELLGVELNVVSAREKVVATIGGALSIGLLCLVAHLTVGMGSAPVLVMSMGATAVLLFAVPHGQLSQPWPVIGGHTLSALVGVLCAKWISHPVLAAGLSVGLAIAVMHQLKCIHPPGGATALTAVLGGAAIRNLGFDYVWCPVLINAVGMVGLAVLFNGGFPWRRYPARLQRISVPQELENRAHEPLVEALKEMDLFVDLDESDLIRLSLEIHKRMGAK